MNAVYFQSLQSYIDEGQLQEDEWYERALRCAHRILTAISMHETAESTLQKTGSILLPPIGFYYSLYHIGIAMLYLDFKSPFDEVKGLRYKTHQDIHKMIQNQLVNTQLIQHDFLIWLENLRHLRNFVNYGFGNDWQLPPWLAERFKVDVSKEYNVLKKIIGELYLKTGEMFDFSIEFIHNVILKVWQGSSLNPIWTAIGDGGYYTSDESGESHRPSKLGDDLLCIYLSKDDESRVKDYLIAKYLTS